MAIPEFIELFDSGSGELTLNDDGTRSRDVSLRYLVGEKPGYLEAEQWGKAKAPLTYRGHRRKKLACQSLGNRWWIVTADYTNAAIQDDGEDNQDDASGDPVANTVAFDTTGGTEHISASLRSGDSAAAETSYGASGVTPPFYNGAINVDGDQVHGTDIVVPAFSFTETWVMPSAWVLDTYVEALYSLTGTVNNARFRSFDAGECLFLGARGEMTRGQTLVSIVFSFQAKPNRENFWVGSSQGGVGGINEPQGIQVTTKRGWDFMWVRYSQKESNNSVVPTPEAVYVNQVYELADFSGLKIGTTWPAVYQSRQTFSRIAS
jgi:hypothetical protein